MRGSFSAGKPSYTRRVTASIHKCLLRTLRKSETGQATVELALVLPVVLLILLGILDFGRAFNTDNTTNHLANLGARFAAVGTFPSGKSGESLCEYINSSAAPSNLKAKLGVKIAEPTVAVGEPVEVQVTSNYHWLKFIQGAIGRETATAIVGSATMRIENTANGSMACSIAAPS
jgi:Flp pilus assembly protein TadG